VRHAFSFAFSAGESVLFAGFVFGASDDTACLCRAYTSSLSRFYSMIRRKAKGNGDVHENLEFVIKKHVTELVIGDVSSRILFLLPTYRWRRSRIPILHVSHFSPELRGGMRCA